MKPWQGQFFWYTRIMKSLKLFAILLIAFVAGWYMLVGTKSPQSDLVWDDAASKQVSTVTNGNLLTLYDLRDWTYASGTILSKEWAKETTVNTESLVGVWFLLEPFSEWQAVGHTYLTFEFQDGNNISFSVEARRESHEDYSALKGTFRNYELSYTWGTERDLLTRRLLYLQHPLRMYPLNLEPEVQKQLLLSLAAQTNFLKEQPRFYNTLTANCTSILAKEVNRAYPNSIPYHISWNLPGYSDTFLMKEGHITMRGNIDETIARYDLSQYRKEVADVATSSPAIFSESVRLLLR